MFANKGIIKGVEAETKDNKIDEVRIQEMFEKAMIENGTAPCKWIIQVTPALKQADPLTTFLETLSCH
jgi:hypothetical protein